MELKQLRICYITAMVVLSELLIQSTGLTTTKVKDVDSRFKLKCPVQESSTVRWLKNNRSLEAKPHIKMKRKGIILKFNGVKLKDSGKYSCDKKVNGTWTRVMTWQVKVRQQRPVADQPEPEPDCGKPIEHGIVKYCNYETFPRCKSFPATPRDAKITLFLFNELPAIYVQWKAPLTGYGDLWGYAVQLLGYKNDANKQECYQINTRIRTNVNQSVTFYTENKDLVCVHFEAEYEVTLTSLPSHDKKENSFVKRVIVPEKCKWEKLKDLPECYKVSNLTATAKHVSKEGGWKINVTWEEHVKYNDSILNYKIHWMSSPDESELYNETTVGVNQTHLSFRIPSTTRCINLTIIVFGKTLSGVKTKYAFTELPHIGECSSHEPPMAIDKRAPDERTLRIVIIVCSVIFSILLVIVFMVIHRYYYKPVVLKLPPAIPSNGDINEPMLENQQNKRKVYIMHSSCCEKCKWAVNQFGDLLCKTGLIDVGLDLWDTLEMLPNKPLYYEKQITESDCVVVVTDNAMKQCALTSEDGKPFDDKYVRFQLDLIRGEITNKPDTRKYIPVYISSVNSTKKDIPDFLSSRVSHSLPQEIDRVVFHVLNIEQIQPRRRRMIAVIGGNDHPYDEAKSFFEAAIDDAARHHWESQTTRNKSDDTKELYTYPM